MSTVKIRVPADLAKLFADVASVEAMTRALAVCAAHEVRTVSFNALMAEQSATKLRLTTEFGANAERDLQRFFNSYPAFAARAELCNVMGQPDFALAAVRTLRASLY